MRKAASAGLLVAWAVHEIEETTMMAPWLVEHLPRLRRRFPGVPEQVWDRMQRDARPEHVRTAIALMGLVMAAAAADGVRSRGRSTLYQAALLGYGVHGVIHLGVSLAVRGYTPGVLTTPVIVLPFSGWALREMRRAGVPLRVGRASLAALAIFPLGLAGAHALSRVLRTGRPTADPA